MLLALFFGIFAIALSFIFLSAIEKESIYSLIGFSFIFILSVFVLIPGQLEIQSGQLVTTSYSYNGTSVSMTTEQSTPTYSYFTGFINHFLGFWMLMISFTGIFLSMVNVKRVFKKDG